MVKGLIHVLEALIGETVTIELRNSTIATGTLASIDQAMTAHLTGAKVVPARGEPELHHELTIRGMNIRCFLLNETTDLDVLLKKAAVNETRSLSQNRKGSNNNKKGSGGGDQATKRPFGGKKPAPKIAGQIRQRDE
jgi:small nuclear ribonucleoprotein D1